MSIFICILPFVCAIFLNYVQSTPHPPSISQFQLPGYSQVEPPRTPRPRAIRPMRSYEALSRPPGLNPERRPRPAPAVPRRYRENEVLYRDGIPYAICHKGTPIRLAPMKREINEPPLEIPSNAVLFRDAQSLARYEGNNFYKIHPVSGLTTNEIIKPTKFDVVTFSGAPVAIFDYGRFRRFRLPQNNVQRIII